MINLNETKQEKLKKLKRGRIFSIVLSFVFIISLSFVTPVVSNIMLRIVNIPALNNIYQKLTVGMHLVVFIVLASISYMFIGMSLEASRKIKKIKNNEN